MGSMIYIPIQKILLYLNYSVDIYSLLPNNHSPKHLNLSLILFNKSFLNFYVHATKKEFSKNKKKRILNEYDIITGFRVFISL